MVTEKSCSLLEQQVDLPQACHENEEVRPVQPVQMNIYQSNTYRKGLSRLYFNIESRVQERQQVKDQQSYISAYVVYLTYPSSS